MEAVPAADLIWSLNPIHNLWNVAWEGKQHFFNLGIGVAKYAEPQDLGYQSALRKEFIAAMVAKFMENQIWILKNIWIKKLEDLWVWVLHGIIYPCNKL